MGDTDNLPVGPGFLGFLAVFVLAVALWFLMRNMNSRMRRMAYRERDRIEQEQREQGGHAGDAGAGDADTGDAGAGGADTAGAHGPDDGAGPHGRGPTQHA